MEAKSPIVLWPQGFTLNGYLKFLSQNYVYTGYLQTIIRSFGGTALSIILMSLAAYAISKRYLPFKGPITGFFVFTMFFSGGMIPTYLLIKDLHLINNPLVFIVAPPFLFNTFYMLIIRNFFMSVPASLEESAKIDGANDISIFFNIIIPLSMPVLMTVSLWQVVNHWNSWFDSLLYIKSLKFHVIQVHIRRIVIEQSEVLSSGAISFTDKADMPTGETLRATAIMITVIPILLMYPFIKKYFVKGIMVGAVKG